MLLAAISFHPAVVFPKRRQADTAKSNHEGREKHDEYNQNSNHQSTPAQLRAIKQAAA